MNIYSESPYFDDYDKSKNYTQVIAIPGRAEQAREFTQIQTIQRDFLERLGNAVFKDGHIVSGCTLILDGTTATIQAGRIFLDGLVREVAESSVQITNAGIERILVALNTTLVTENEDATLKDPAQGFENFGLPGAYREKQDVVFSVVSGEESESAEGVTVFTLSDGALLNSSDNSEYLALTDMLAERTYDENGNFKIEGLYLKTTINKDEENDKLLAYVDAGKAYVHGYEVSKSAVSSIPLDLAVEDRGVDGESHVYSSTIPRYLLSNSPVASVANLTCAVQVSEPNKTRGSVAGGYDALMFTPVKELVSINQGGTVYNQYVDYKLFSDKVDWSLPGAEPAVGSSYSVTYVYNKQMVEGTDYRIVNEPSGSYLEFLSGGDKPTENSLFYVYYRYTLARRDLILLDSTGRLSAIKGSPDRRDDLITPYNMDRDKLELGHIDVYPTFVGQTDLAKVENYNTVRLTQENLYAMLRRVENLETNIAEMDLDRVAESYESSSDLMGIYTDGFTGVTKCDLAYDRLIGGDRVKFDCCIDYDNAELTTSSEVSDYALEVDTGKSSALGMVGDIVTAPFTYVEAVRQNQVTGIIKVNPYAAFEPMCSVKISPSIDNWVDREKIQVYDTVEKTTYSTSHKTYSHGWWSTKATRNLGSLKSVDVSSSTSLKTSVSTATKTAVAESLVEYMRVRTVNVVGKAFASGLNNIQCIFNGVKIPMTATGTTVQLPNGQVRADIKGGFTSRFMVPENIPCGKVNVEFKGIDNLGVEHSGTAIYSAEGTLLTTTVTKTSTVTRNYNVLITTRNLYNRDPLAQTFVFTEDTVVGQIGMYFAEKDASRPVIVQVRDVVNGYPGETVLAEVTVDSDDVKVPVAPSTVPVKTLVTLNQPIYCYAGTYYCFVVMSDSNDYTMFYAGLGEPIWGNPTKKLTANPYTVGVMFSSSNASTWTAHQGSDLKFEIYKANYTSNAEIVFRDVFLDSETFSGVMLDSAYEDYKNAGITWFYRIKEGALWLPIDTLVFRDLQAVTNRVQLKAVLKIVQNTSPFVAGNRASVKCFKDAGKATYISKALLDTDFDEEYRSLKVSYQVALPAGASCNVFYMDTDNGDWNQIKIDDSIIDPDTSLPVVSLSTKQIDQEFVQYTWTVSKLKCILDNPASPGSKFYKIRIDLDTPVVYNRPRVRELMSFMKFM